MSEAKVATDPEWKDEPGNDDRVRLAIRRGLRSLCFRTVMRSKLSCGRGEIMPEVTIRTAATIDAPGIVALLRASIIQLCAADHGQRDAPLQQWLANKTVPNVEAWVNNPDNIMLVAELGSRMAGVGCLRKDGHIMLNYVSPDYRFLGVSKTVLAALEDRARDLALSMVALESTKTALAFYKAAGFAEAGLRTSKHDLPAYPMTKCLRPASGN